jgi:hypothetical protein
MAVTTVDLAVQALTRLGPGSAAKECSYRDLERADVITSAAKGKVRLGQTARILLW